MRGNFSLGRARLILPLLLIGLCLGWSPELPGQTYPCDGAFYLVLANSTGSTLQRLERNPATGAIRLEGIPLSEPSRKLTCLGFNVQDLYLYALDFDTYELLRIDRAGLITRLGIPENLDVQKYEYHAGEIGPGGGSLTVVGRNKATGLDDIIYNISLSPPRYYAGPISIPSGTEVNLSDLATDPLTGIRYGFDNRSKKVVTVGSSSVSTYDHQNLSITADALFFDRQGNLFGYGDPAGTGGNTIFYAFNKNSGKERAEWSGPSARDTDGCSCPYTVAFQRTVTPEIVLPCSEVEIVYRIVNHSGSSRLNTVFEDVLPPVFTITSVKVEKTSIYVPKSGVGSSTLRLENLEMLVQENILRVVARVEDASPATYPTQAFIRNWPAALGELKSDDPSTDLPADPNLIRIGDPQQLELEPVVQYNCTRDTALLFLPIQADTYRWSDGSTDPALAATRPGTYWVEAGNDCWTVRDTIRLDTPPPSLQLDLGDDRRVRINEETALPLTTNAGPGASYAWSLQGEGRLSCTDCARPTLRAISDVLLTLTLTDGEGCTVTDSVAIAVELTRAVYRPTAFSPDDDGVNDRFFLQGRDGAVRHLRIFNRWGALVFESRDGRVGDDRHGWDGTVRGRPAEAGVYLYAALVEFSDGVEEVFNGEITLVRAR